MVTFKIELGKPKKDGSRKIYIRVCNGREFKRIPFWMSASKDQVSGSGEITNIALDVALTQKISEYKNRLLYDNVPDTWSAEEIADYLVGQTNESEADKKKKMSSSWTSLHSGGSMWRS